MPVRPSPCRITRSSARSSLCACAAAAALCVGRAETRLGERSGEPATVGTELLSHELPQVIWCRARPNLEPLVDQEVCELPPGCTGEPPRIARQVAKPAADGLRGTDRACGGDYRQ